MFDRDIRRRDEHRFGMRKHVEAILAIVMTLTGWSDAAERHRLDKQVDVDLVDGAAAERKLADEAVDHRLVATEDERRGGMRCRCNPAKGFVQRAVGQLSLRTQVLPAARTAIAGRSSNVRGPLDGPMTKTTP